MSGRLYRQAMGAALGAEPTMEVLEKAPGDRSDDPWLEAPAAARATRAAVRLARRSAHAPSAPHRERGLVLPQVGAREVLYPAPVPL